MIAIVLLDDMMQHNNMLEMWISQICKEENLESFIALATTNIQDVLDFAHRNIQPTVYFLDIELEQADNGINVCKKIKEISPMAYIVYVSAYQQYALECCRTHASDFLLKPFTQENVRQCLLTISKDIYIQHIGELLYIPLGSKTISVDQEKIIYFSVKGNQLTAHTLHGLYTWRSSFKTLIPSLQIGPFIQLNRSYIVNIKYIQEIDWMEERLTVISGVTFRISRRSKKMLRESMHYHP